VTLATRRNKEGYGVQKEEHDSLEGLKPIQHLRKEHTKTCTYITIEERIALASDPDDD
jgi:hypothetical protein